MSKKLFFIYHILFFAVVLTWAVPDLFRDQAWAITLNEFWAVEKHYLALIAWTIFDLGCLVGSGWQKRQQRKRCTLRHGDDPKRHNFVFVSKSDNKVENFKQDNFGGYSSTAAVKNYKDGAIEELNQEIKK